LFLGAFFTELFYYIERPPLGFQVGTGEILADNAGAEELDAGDKEQDAYQGGPAAGRTAPD